MLTRHPTRARVSQALRLLGCSLLAGAAAVCFAQAAADPQQAHLAEGVRLLRDGHAAEARQELNLAVRAAPGSADALTWRGICENQLQQYPAAATDFQAALLLDSAMLPAHYNFALTLIRLGRTEDAIAQFRLVVAAQPDAVQALYNLAVLLESTHSFAEAADTLRKAQAAAPSDPGITLHLLLDDLQLNNTSEIPALVNQLSEPSTPASMERDAGTALLASARFPEAVTLLTAARDREPAAPGMDLLLARALIGDHQDAAAISLLHTPLVATPQASDRAYLLGLAYLDQGATAEATQQFHAAATLNPRDARPVYHLALLAAGAPDHRDEAARLLQSAIDLDPTNPSYPLALARLLLVEDRAAEARDLLLRRKVGGQAPAEDEAQQHALLGVALASLHQTAEAIPQLEQALKLDPSLALADNVLGFCFLQQGDYAKAAAAYGQASELDPARALYAHDAALAFERADRPQEATRYAERAVQRNDASATDHVLLGKLYAAADRRDDAVQQLLRAATLDPDSDAACYLLARTYQQQGQREQALAWSNRLTALKQKHEAAFALQKKAAAEAIRSSRLLEGGSYTESPAEQQ